MRAICTFFLSIMVAAVVAGAQHSFKGGRAASGERALTLISVFSVTPTTLTFSATDPDGSPVAGSSTVTATWGFTGVALNGNWRIDVQAPSTTFTNCSRVPVSAVRVTCTATNLTGIGLGGSASCASPSTLSTTATTVASGAERLGLSTTTVTLSYTFTDSWRYTAPETPSCSMSLAYILQAD